MKQIDLYRNMSGEKRLEIAFRLSDLVRELAILNIKSDNKNLSHKKVIHKLNKRLE